MAAVCLCGNITGGRLPPAPSRFIIKCMNARRREPLCHFRCRGRAKCRDSKRRGASASTRRRNALRKRTCYATPPTCTATRRTSPSGAARKRRRVHPAAKRRAAASLQRKTRRAALARRARRRGRLPAKGAPAGRHPKRRRPARSASARRWRRGCARWARTAPIASRASCWRSPSIPRAGASSMCSADGFRCARSSRWRRRWR